MRKFISKNVMVVAAMAIAAGSYGLMSFGTSANLNTNWYAVTGVSISPTPLGTPPSDDPDADCSTEKQTNMCAIQLELDTSKPFPSTVAEAYSDHDVLDEAFRD